MENKFAELIGNEWDNILRQEFEADYFEKLSEFLDSEYSSKKIYPAKENIYNAFKLTPPDSVKVVLLGQDPYIKEGQAHGLAFSVNPGVSVPPSLRNIYKELNSDLGIAISKIGYLVPWAEQGIMLLNTVLTVEEGKSNSHIKKGWETFTDAVLKYLGQKNAPIVFILWGRNAHSKEKYITASENHLVLKAPHPSPLSASTGFFGCKHFSATNEFLRKNNIAPIDWSI